MLKTEGFLCCSIHPNYKINKLLVNNIASIHGRRITQLIDWCENGLLIDSNIDKTKKILSDSCLNDSKCEYLISLLDNAKLNKNNEMRKENNKKLNGNDMKLTKDNVLEKWADAKLLLKDKKEFIDLAEDSFIPFANLYDEFDEDMKKDLKFLSNVNPFMLKTQRILTRTM
ncbi:MAG: hypothetical protein IK017_01415 [Paludibacteraceae bacterium]|nr:hypothetical protein [Paludibacteraceae bacterium]